MSNCRVGKFSIWSWSPRAIRPPRTSTRYPSETGPATSFSAISKTIELLAVDAAAFAAVEKDNLELRGPDESRRCSAHAFHVRLGFPGYRLG